MAQENFICNFETKLVNVSMRTAEAFYNIFMYLYNKNILEYVQIARNGTESVIPYTEGRSTKESCPLTDTRLKLKFIFEWQT